MEEFLKFGRWPPFADAHGWIKLTMALALTETSLMKLNNIAYIFGSALFCQSRVAAFFYSLVK